MTGQLFFLSYAHAAPQPSREANRHVIRFFNELSENVSWLVSRPTGEEPGFLDRSMNPGSRWTPELLDSLGTCQVFVALIAAPYLTCNWCGMEWCGFAMRSVLRRGHAGSTRQTAILPVIWAPYAKDQTPAVVAGVQRFAPDGLPMAGLAARYEEHGVLGLKRTGRDSDYHAIVWELAKAIAELQQSHWVEPRELRYEELRDVFTEDPAAPGESGS
jgi:hypothetical protein